MIFEKILKFLNKNKFWFLIFGFVFLCGLILISCQGLVNVNGSENGLIISESLRLN